MSDWWYWNGRPLLVVAAIIIFLFLLHLWYSVDTLDYIEGEIISTQIEGGETHFVFQHTDGDKEVLRNDDNFVMGKVNSSDLMIDLQVGKEYRLKVNGRRRPFWSTYRNILVVE